MKQVNLHLAIHLKLVPNLMIFSQTANTPPDVTSQKGSSFVRDIFQSRSRLLPEEINGSSGLFKSLVHITALKFENKINQVLHGLKTKSQEAEYKFVQEKLYF